MISRDILNYKVNKVLIKGSPELNIKMKRNSKGHTAKIFYFAKKIEKQ